MKPRIKTFRERDGRLVWAAVWPTGQTWFRYGFRAALDQACAWYSGRRELCPKV